MKAITELLTVLLDALSTGDLRGHLAAWWSVVSGNLTGRDALHPPLTGGAA
jgi:hypothetical protein